MRQNTRMTWVLELLRTRRLCLLLSQVLVMVLHANMSAPNVAGIWVEGVGSTFNGHSSKIRASSNVAGATVRGAVITNGGTISSDNDDIAATALATRTLHFPDAQGMSTSYLLLVGNLTCVSQAKDPSTFYHSMVEASVVYLPSLSSGRSWFSFVLNSVSTMTPKSTRAIFLISSAALAQVVSLPLCWGGFE